MRALLSEIRNHRALFFAVTSLQALFCMTPYVMLFYAPRLEDGLFGGVPDIGNVSPWLLMFWLWFAAVGLIGAGGYWGAEAGGRFSLEGMRHGSFRRWLGRKLGAVAALSLIVYGLVPYAFLAARYPGQGRAALLASCLLALYGLHLALALVALSMAGAGTGHAFVAVLFYHAMNLVLEGMGLPSVIGYFMIAERGSAISLAAAAAATIAALALMRELSGPGSVNRKGSEFA